MSSAHVRKCANVGQCIPEAVPLPNHGASHSTASGPSSPVCLPPSWKAASTVGT